MNVLINCLCGKRFPINPSKHPNRDVVFCPFCHASHKNSFFNSEWKPNKAWQDMRSQRPSQPFTIGAMRRALQGIFGRGK